MSTFFPIEVVARLNQHELQRLLRIMDQTQQTMENLAPLLLQSKDPYEVNIANKLLNNGQPNTKASDILGAPKKS